MSRSPAPTLLVAAAALSALALAAAGGTAPGVSTVVAKVKVGGQPCGVVGTPGGIWVADYAGDRLVRIDPATATVAGRVQGVRRACELTYARGALWVPSRTGVLYRVDPVAGRITARIPVRGELDDVVAAAGSVWVAEYTGRQVVRVNPRTNRVARRIPLPRAQGGASGIAAAGGELGAREPAPGKFAGAIGHVFAAEHAEPEHLGRRQLWLEVGIESAAHRCAQHVAVALLHFVADDDGAPAHGRN